MNKKFAVWCAAGALSLASSGGLAQVVNDSQQGSLLVWPRIDVSPNKATLVQITNNANRFVNIQCYWMNANKQRVDFEFQLSRNQTFVFDAATGQASVDDLQVLGFPTSAGLSVGELICFAVEHGIPDKGVPGVIDQVAWNFLIGKATVLDFDVETAYEYAAYAFRAHNVNIDQPVGNTAGSLLLNGGVSGNGNPIAGYDACPKVLLGQFSPVGAIVPIADGTGNRSTAGALANQLTVMSCNQDLRQQPEPVYTKLDWLVYNDDEVGFSGAWACMDSWYQTWLGDKVFDYASAPLPYFGPASPDGWKNFVREFIFSDAAMYRLWSTAAPKTCGSAYTPQQRVGLIGIQASWIKMGLKDDGTWDPAGGYKADGTPNIHPEVRIKIADDATASGLSSESATLRGKIRFDPALVPTKQ